MNIKNKDMVKILKILNDYFNIYINKEKDCQNFFIETVELHQVHSQSLKHIYVTGEYGKYELWINESTHYETEYVFFYYDENKSRKTIFFKNLEKLIDEESLLDCFNVLSKLKAVKIKNF